MERSVRPVAGRARADRLRGSHGAACGVSSPPSERSWSMARAIIAARFDPGTAQAVSSWTNPTAHPPGGGRDRTHIA